MSIPHVTIAASQRRTHISEHDCRDGGGEDKPRVPIGSPEAAEIIATVRADVADKRKNRKAQQPGVGNRVTLPRREAA